MNAHRAFAVPLSMLIGVASACGADDAMRSGAIAHDAAVDGGRTPAWAVSDRYAVAGRDVAIEDASAPSNADASAGPSPPDSGAGSGAAGSAGAAGSPAIMCIEVTQACDSTEQCCGELSCDTTSLGRVCCGEQGAPCATENGEDCCRDLLCIAGHCGYELDDSCNPPCTAAPALVLERERLAAIGGSFLGICGDANHSYGFHVAAANLPADDYSLRGDANRPVCEWHAAAIDIGMDWPVARDWLRWLIAQKQGGGFPGVAEVIGSYDGVDVRYWSESSGWSTDGEAYSGSGHDSWTHVSIYRSMALQDHGILAGWTATAGP